MLSDTNGWHSVHEQSCTNRSNLSLCEVLCPAELQCSAELHAHCPLQPCGRRRDECHSADAARSFERGARVVTSATRGMMPPAAAMHAALALSRSRPWSRLPQASWRASWRAAQQLSPKRPARLHSSLCIAMEWATRGGEVKEGMGPVVTVVAARPRRPRSAARPRGRRPHDGDAEVAQGRAGTACHQRAASYTR